MRLLFALSVGSFCTVLWLALALARRVRRDQAARSEEQARSKPAAPAPATEFFEAGEFRTPRVLRVNQDVLPQGIRRLRQDVPAPQRTELDQRREQVASPHKRGNPFSDASRLSAPDEVLDEVAVAAPSEAVLIGSKLHLIPSERSSSEEATAPVIASRNTATRDISGERKSPQSAHSGTFRRVDLSHYNKDLGDLTDPYTHSARNSGTRPSVAKNA